MSSSIFNAALQGIISNPNFFGATMQGSADSAIGFALECEEKVFLLHDKALVIVARKLCDFMSDDWEVGKELYISKAAEIISTVRGCK